MRMPLRAETDEIKWGWSIFPSKHLHPRLGLPPRGHSARKARTARPHRRDGGGESLKLLGLNGFKLGSYGNQKREV